MVLAVTIYRRHSAVPLTQGCSRSCDTASLPFPAVSASHLASPSPSLTRDGSNPDCAGNCTAAMIHWAIDVYDWARNDSRVVGINPWHMNGAPKVNASFEPGLVYMPELLQTYKRIGFEIVSGLLRDIS